MIQTSLTINYFINFYVLKSIKAQKKGRMVCECWGPALVGSRVFSCFWMGWPSLVDVVGSDSAAHPSP